MRPADRLGIVLIFICAATAGPPARADSPAPAPGEIRRAIDETLEAQLQVLAKTERILEDKHSAGSEELRARVRAAYKILRPGRTPLWRDEETRARVIQRRALVRRMLARDRAELALLQDELESVARARERIERERRAASELEPPAPGSLGPPVASSRVVEPFGSYQHASRARLSRRGIVLSSRPGRRVRAVAQGEVRYAGEVRGLGHAVIIDHGDFRSVVGHLEPGGSEPGDRVERGDIIGKSASRWVYLEIRLEVGAGGFPVDPEPLVDWRR